MIPLSILDLSPIIEGGSASDSLANSLDLAQHAERWAYHRYWVAEHHGMAGIASAATSVVIGHIAGGTSRIRVGAGGIMLPNHAPLIIAEQFGTLEALYPGRIDLGLGRAPGTDPATSRALRRNLNVNVEQFPQDVLELINYFGSDLTDGSVQAVPGQGMSVPVWVLGSSTFGALLAAHLGLPYAFASHFAPGQMMAAIQVYREQFKPSETLAKPYVMPGISVFSAEREEDARLLASSWQQAFINLYSGKPSRLQPPVADYFDSLEPFQQQMLNDVMACSVVGTPEQVGQQMEDFIDRTGADELIIAGQIFNHEARLRSYEIIADVMMDRR